MRVVEDSERWRPVKGFEGLYEVSDLGNVRSLPKIVKKGFENRGTQFHTGGPMKPRMCSSQLVVRLYDNKPGAKDRFKNKQIAISRLVYETFIGEIPQGLIVKTLDDNPENCRWDNLKLITRSELLSRVAFRRKAKVHFG